MKINSAKFNRIIDLLFKTAETSLMLQRHACAIVLGGKIVSIQENKFDKFTKHSEISAINHTKSVKLNRCVLIVIRVNRIGDVVSSKPCNDCIKYIKQCGIKRIYYSSDTGFEYTNSTDLENEHKTFYHRKMDLKK